MSKRGSGSSTRSNGGFSIAIRGKEKIYFQAAGGEFRGLQDANDIISKEMANKLLKNGKAKPISKAEMNKIKTARNKERAAKPDYELGGGVPWGNKENRKATRASRLAGRAQRRRR